MSRDGRFRVEAHGVSRRQFLRGATAGSLVFGGASGLLAACSSGGTQGQNAAGATGKLTQLSIGLDEGPDKGLSIADNLTQGRDVQRLWYDPLMRRDHSEVVVPVLATSWKQTSESHWVFDLDPRAKFADGTPVTSADVAFSLKLMQTPSYAPATDVLGWHNFDTSDPRRFEMDTDGPGNKSAGLDVSVIDNMADLAYIFSEKWYTSHNEGYRATHAMGSGPYELVSYIPGSSVQGKARPDYWRGTPPVSEVNYQFIPDENTRIAALLSGQVDLINDIDLIDVGRITSSANAHASVVPDNRIWFVEINAPGDPALADVRVRQAFNYAVDKQQILKTFYQGKGYIASALSFPGCFGHNPSLPPYPYDPKKASQLLQAAHWDPNKVLTFDIYSVWENVSIAVINYLKAVGVKVNANVMTPDAFSQKIFTEHINPDLMTLAFHNQSLDMGSFYNLTTVSTGGENWVHFHDPQVDALTNQALLQANASGRATLLGKVDARVHEVAPDIFLFNTPIAYGVANSINYTGREDGVIDVFSDVKPA